MSPQGVSPQGVSPKGVSPQGVSPQGVSPKGVSPKGVSPQGVSPQGVSPQGVSLQEWRDEAQRSPEERREGKGEVPREMKPKLFNMTSLTPRPPTGAGMMTSAASEECHEE